MPGVSGVTVVTNARIYYSTRAAAGASSARHSPRPLNFGGKDFMHNSGASRRGNADSYFGVIARSQRVARMRAGERRDPSTPGVTLRRNNDMDTTSNIGCTAWVPAFAGTTGGD
jgi:hypothetical protein